MQTPCVRCIFRPRPLTNNTVRSLFVGPRPFWIGIIRKISKSQLRSVSALRAKTVRKPHGLETTRARYSFLNFGSVPSCALFGLVLVFWHRFDGSWCYCGLLCFHRSSFSASEGVFETPKTGNCLCFVRSSWKQAISCKCEVNAKVHRRERSQKLETQWKKRLFQASYNDKPDCSIRRLR